MPIHKSAEKRMRQGERRKLVNKTHRTYLRKAVKSYRELQSGEPAKAEFPKISSTVDKAAHKGIIHHRKASRLKSRLARKTVSA